MNTNSTSKPMDTTSSDGDIQKKVGWILISLTLILVALNVFLQWTIGTAKMLPFAELIGYALSTVMLAIFITGLFQIGKRFRNLRSRLKIFCWTLFVLILVSFGQIAEIKRHSMAHFNTSAV